MRRIILLALLPFLVGCATNSRTSVDALQARIPESLMQPCADPVSLPERPLTSAETARGWASDRLALVECRNSKTALVGAVRAQKGTSP